MFKKPFTTGQSHKVSGADRKKLRRSLEKAFGCNEDALEAVIPAKAGEMEVVKLASPSRTVLYVHDGEPLLIDPNGKGDYVPTVFALWRLPTLLPQVFVKHPAVTQYIVGGADLMLPGVAIPPGGLPAFEKGQPVAVCCPGNPAPIAVGHALLSSADAMLRASASAGKGKLVELVQHYGDCLWSDLGGRALPNESFLPHAVVPLGMSSVEQALQQVGVDAAGQIKDGMDAWDQEDEEQQHEEVAAGSDGAAVVLSGADVGPGSVAAAAGQMAGLAVSGSSGADGEGAGAGGAAEGGADDVNMDELLEAVLLQALHKSVKDTDLPMNSSVLWSQHMLPVRPAGASLDVKKTKHKKLSKLVQSYAKAGLLTCKEDKHSGDVIVTGVNRKSNLYTEYRPYKAAGSATAAAADSGAAPAAGAGPGSGSAAAASARGAAGAVASPLDELVIEEVYKPTREVKPIFEELGLRVEAVYTAPEAAEVALAYVKHARLEEGAPDNMTIVLDPTLCDALFKGVIKKGETFPTHLPKAQLRELFLKRMQSQCRVTKGPYQVLRKGQIPSVNISSEKRQGNKKVTKLVGVEAFLVDPDQVAGECQRRFACSTTVSELPGKNAGHEVVLQGSFVDELAEFIHKTYAIPKKYFLVKK